MRAAAHSFFSVFLGWLIPFVGYLGVMQSGSYITDFRFLLFWPLLFTSLGWILVGIRLAISLSKKEDLKLVTSVVSWTAATTLSFLVLAAVFRFGLLFLIWWPFFMGVIAGVSFWYLQRTARIPAWALIAIPLVFFPLVRYVLVPVGVRYFPYTTHVLGEGAIGNEALLNVYSSINIGDTYEHLHRAYPQIFDQPILARSSYGGGGRGFSIRFDATRSYVTFVEVRRASGTKTDEPVSGYSGFASEPAVFEQ